MKLSSFVLLYFNTILSSTYALLCYNGTLSNSDFGEDPLHRKWLFGPGRRETAKLRCSLTILCKEALVNTSSALHCYNCSSTHLTWDQCGGNFIKTSPGFNSSRAYLVNCTGEDAMCFVRSWTTRARHSWIVQRGCYQTRAQDPFPRAMDVPTRAMTCRFQRLAEADYKVCLCKADWCNQSQHAVPFNINNIYFSVSFITLFGFLRNIQIQY